MPTVKEQLLADINIYRSALFTNRNIAAKMFLLDPAFVFKEYKAVGFQILNSIAQKFRVPLGCVKIAGSSQTGFSPFKNREFLFGQSDLDIAIVSPPLFQRYSEIVCDITNGYKDLTKFEDQKKAEQFRQNLELGFFRPDLMPYSRDKTEWLTFFNAISNQHSKIFKNVNGGIYFSEFFFSGKQIAAIEKLKTN
jgi:hypothetical protein